MIRLSKKQLKEKREFVMKYMGGGNNATLSEVDPNANVSHKSVATLDGELNKDVTVQVNEYIHAEKIKELFGRKYQKRFINDLKNHVIYSHDCSSIKPYCSAISLVPFIYNGASSLAGDSLAPKHLASFCGSYVNLMYSLAGGFSGALADVSLLTYFHYFAKKDYGDNYLKTNAKEVESFFQQIVYSLNSPAGARNHQSIFYNTSIFDRDYFEAMFGEAQYPDGASIIYEEVNKLQKFFMNWFGEERHKALLTFPVITASYLTKDGKAKDTEFVDFLAGQMAKGHSFFHYHSDNASALSSCCRLRNEVEMNQFAYSLGGTGMMTGSMKVITLNINRITQKGINLVEKVKDVHKYLIAYRVLMQEMEEAHLLPAYDEGYIALDKQYVTVGINGVVEAAEYLGYEITPNEDYLNWVKHFFGTISTQNKLGAKEYTEMLGRKVLINTEMVPAENLGVKFAKWDKRSGLKVPRDCYNSYLYRVEDDSIDFVDKFKMHGEEVLKYLDGGSAVHQNFNEIPTKGTWLKIIQKAIDTGSSYWTYNVKSTCCNSCGYIDMNTRQTCSKCGSTDVDYLTRVIGYLKKIKSFSAARQKEAGLRFYHKSLK